MEFVHSSSARRVADPASELLACTSEFRCVSTFGGEDKSNEQSSAGNKDDAVPDVRILPSKPNQPKLNFPLRCFGKQRRGFSVHWYEKYPWLHYLDNEDAVLCFYCATAVKCGKMPLTGYVDSVFTKCGFNNWKKAIDKFAKHEKSESHYHAVSIKVTKLILVMPATNAVSERSFSTLRRLKTWLRSTMNQDRLNWCMMLHIHNNDTDALDLNYLANEFVSQNSSRHSIFGKFV